MQQQSDLIYGLNDRPPLRGTLFAALQHLLAIFVAIITPPLIISSALKFDLQTTGVLVSMSLFVSGVTTFIQCHRIGPLGAGLLCIQGTSFSFITSIIGAGMLGMVNGHIDAPTALSYIFGAEMGRRKTRPARCVQKTAKCIRSPKIYITQHCGKPLIFATE